MSPDQKKAAFIENLRKEPPVPCDYKLGDQVKFTNEYGVEFSPMTVIGFAEDDSFYGRFIHLDSSSYWFPSHPDALSPID